MTRSNELPGIVAESLDPWFQNRVPKASPPLAFELIAGGRSNLTFRVDDSAGNRFVLRRPPTGAVLPTAHDVAREHRILAALEPTAVPTPPPLALCEDDGVTGAPFYVMAWVDGHVLNDHRAIREVLGSGARGHLGAAVVECLAALHRVSADSVGLGDLGRKDAYLARQLKRWHRQWNQSKTRECPLMDEVHQGLQVDMPVQVGSTIVHGDFRIGNMLVSEAGEIRALLDWELCTLGDPLADLAYLLNDWEQPGESTKLQRSLPTSAGGFPTRDDVVQQYETLSGRDASSIHYYRAFQYWRLAAIAEGVAARYEKGVMGTGSKPGAMDEHVDDLAEAAATMLDEHRASH